MLVTFTWPEPIAGSRSRAEKIVRSGPGGAAAETEPAPPADRRGAVRWFSGWSEERRRNTFLIVYAVAFLVTAAAIWLVAVAPGASGEGARAAASQAYEQAGVGPEASTPRSWSCGTRSGSSR